MINKYWEMFSWSSYFILFVAYVFALYSWCEPSDVNASYIFNLITSGRSYIIFPFCALVVKSQSSYTVEHFNHRGYIWNIYLNTKGKANKRHRY